MILAGGTGGHVFPALAVAEQLRARDIEVVWLGTRAGLEARLVPAAGIAIEWLTVRGLRGKGMFGWLRAPAMMSKALWEARDAIRRHRPSAVLGMGGYVAGAGALAARWLRVPLVIHEQNAVPGLTNRLAARFANRVLAGFEGAFADRVEAITVGNPVRADIAALPEPRVRRREAGLRPRVLVLGGSQGAEVLNRIVPKAVQGLEASLRPEVWHQTGVRTLEETRLVYQDLGLEARVEPFIDDMASAYGWAELVICRSGALTVSELAAAGVPAVLVPFPHAVDDHQTANARHLSNCDAAVLCPQDQLTPERLTAVLEELLGDREHLLTMAEHARALATPDAAEQVARHCLEVMS